MQEGLVSVVIPVYNRAELLQDAVASCLAQTYRPLEVILVDDGSTDGTADVCRSLARNEPASIRCIVLDRNGGPGIAKEAGRRRARGEFIQYLDSDDILMPWKFSVQVEGLHNSPECGISYGVTRRYRIGATRTETPTRRTGEKIRTLFPATLPSKIWHGSTPLYRASLLERAGPWTDLRTNEDWEYDCRVASLSVRLHYAGVVVSDARNHEGERLTRDFNHLERMKNRARARELVIGHARRAGLNESLPEMRQFAHDTFRLAAKCGAAGLRDESLHMFRLAKSAAGSKHASGYDYRAYELLIAAAGPRLAGAFVQRCYRLWRKRPRRGTAGIPVKHRTANEAAAE